MQNKRGAPPMGTPWSSWPFGETCPDNDYDSIPNLAERWDLGSSMDLKAPITTSMMTVRKFLV
jgi:hypothetical protein